MAKKSGTDAASAPPPGAALEASRTFQLATPVADAAGRMVSEVRLVAPELHHQAQAERSVTASGLQQSAQLIAALSGLALDTVKRLKLRDLTPMGQWIEQQKTCGIKMDIAAEIAAGVKDAAAALASEKTFTLMAPIATEGAPITTITVCEPDLEAAIAVERFKTDAERTAALIAALSGKTIPIVMRMKLSDRGRIERWFGFFSPAGKALPANPDKAA